MPKLVPLDERRIEHICMRMTVREKRLAQTLSKRLGTEMTALFVQLVEEKAEEIGIKRLTPEKKKPRRGRPPKNRAR